MIPNNVIDRIRKGEEVTLVVPVEMHKVWVDGATMVSGPGHLSETQSAKWVKIYRTINPDLPADAIYTENTYR